MEVNVIVAGVMIPGTTKLGIGYAGGIPWDIPDDRAYFRDLTVGNIVIMGRKTWESLPDRYRPLPNRINVVISPSDYDFWHRRPRSDTAVGKYQGAKLVGDMDEALSYAQAQTSGPTRPSRVFIIGGAQTYASFFEHHGKIWDKLYLTRVKAARAPKGSYPLDTFFDMALAADRVIVSVMETYHADYEVYRHGDPVQRGANEPDPSEHRRFS